MSLIELMVGIAIGMIVVAGAVIMMTNQVNEHGKLMQETQIQQDLRATADLMLRDLRRAGFWARPETAVWAPGAPAVASNPYTVVTEGENLVTYAYSRARDYVDTTKNEEDNAIAASESFGFRKSNNVLQSQLGNDNWQPLTDPDTVKINNFTITPVVQTIGLGAYCSPPCADAAGNCPRMEIRRYDISITGQSARDEKVLRTINVSSRLRNDAVIGACPVPP